MRKMVAAAIPLDSVVVVAGSKFKIDEISYSTPRPGMITWVSDNDDELEIRASQEVEVEFLPKMKESKDANTRSY